jgi:two-component system chemotaxis sensor kinase CheA
MSQEIKDFFMEEAEELFDGIHSILLKNEEAGSISEEEIDSLFRYIHTLKGGAGSVELVEFSAYTHHLETFMDMVRNNIIKLDSNIIDFIIESVGSMHEILQEEYDQELDKEEYSQKLNQLVQDIETIKKSDFNKLEQISENQNFGENAAEIVDLFEELKRQILEVKQNQIDAQDAVAGIFRTIHTIKGASQFLNLKYFPIYLHEVESMLDECRNGDIVYTKVINDFMEKATKNAKDIIDQDLNNNVDDEDFSQKLEALKEELVQLVMVLDEPKEDTALLAFELFDEVKDEEPLAFELFDEPEDEIVHKESKTEVPKTIVKKIKKDKKNISLNKAASASIRVNLDKIDQLMNRVGDLVITKSMLFQYVDTIDDDYIRKELSEKLIDLDRDIRELQESVMSVRMVPMENVYARLPKMVRDLSKKLEKKVRFEHIGDSVEIDKMMIEGLMDPLTHIIRNSLDHGLEQPKERQKKGKNEVGNLVISATQESGNIIISISDDGAGIDVEKVVNKALENKAITHEELARMSETDKLMLIFHAGLSTSNEVTQVSGRGVGMDVVMTNINSIGGHVKVFSKKDKGTKIQIILPLTLAILDGLNIVMGKNHFILPLNSIVESLQPKANMIKHVGESDKEILMLRREFIPIIRLYDFFNIEPIYKNLEDGMLIVVKTTNSKVAFFVDDFLNQEQIVVKSLEKNYKKISGISAATIRGDGSIGLILDVNSIVDLQKREG